MVNSTDTVIDIITLVKIFSRKNRCGGPSGDFVKTRSETRQSKINLKQWVPKWVAQFSYLFRKLSKLVVKVFMVSDTSSSSRATTTKFGQPYTA